VSAESLERRPIGNAVGESIRLHLEFPSGAVANLSLSNILEERRRFLSVETGSERLVFDDASEIKAYRETGGDSGQRESLSFVSEPPLAVVVREFVETIKRGTGTDKEVDLATEVVVTLARCAATLGPQK
jgi:hypothetical protein